jgi:hypothetical protein
MFLLLHSAHICVAGLRKMYKTDWRRQNGSEGEVYPIIKEARWAE